jgi:hypothetical protein
VTTSTPGQVVTASKTSTTTTLEFVTTASIPAGSAVVIAADRVAVTANANGVQSVATSAGAFSTLRRMACSCRSSTHDLTLLALQVTTTIPSGSTITLTWSGSTNRYAGVLAVMSNVVVPPVEDATSGVAAFNAAGNISSGPNGSSTTGTAATTAAMPAGDHLVLAALTVQGTFTVTAGAGYTEIAQVKTAAGSSDRGLLLEYANSSSSGVKTATVTYDSSSAYAGVIATLPLTGGGGGPTGPVFKELISGSWVTLTVKEYNGSTWNVVNPEEL